MNLKKITETNRLAWNEAMPYHQKARGKSYRDDFKKKGFSILDILITEKLKEMNFEGKNIAQLCCNNGCEAISIRNLGAGSVVGFDISDEAVNEAVELNNTAGQDCKFIRTDVYDISGEHFNKYDIVFISIGALAWLPDLQRFFKTVSSMLKKGGNLLVYEMHPFLYLMMIEGDKGYEKDNPARIAYSYFRKDPWIETTGIDYIGHKTYDGKESISYTQTISDIINAVIGSGITITEFSEYPHDISNLFALLEKEGNLPLCYILTGQKQ